GLDRLSEAEENEEDMLDKAPGLTPSSRLGCQAVLQDNDAVIEVLVPRYTINQIAGTHGWGAHRSRPRHPPSRGRHALLLLPHRRGPRLPARSVPVLSAPDRRRPGDPAILDRLES